MSLDSSTIQLALAVLAPGGIAGLAVKLMMNGSKERIIEIRDDVRDTKKAVGRLHERVDALELESAEARGYERAMREVGDRKG